MHLYLSRTYWFILSDFVLGVGMLSKIKTKFSSSMSSAAELKSFSSSIALLWEQFCSHAAGTSTDTRAHGYARSEMRHCRAHSQNVAYLYVHSSIFPLPLLSFVQGCRVFCAIISHQVTNLFLFQFISFLLLPREWSVCLFWLAMGLRCFLSCWQIGQ